MAYRIDATTDCCYEGTTCLINKHGICDEQKLSEAEAAIVLGKLAMLKKCPVQGAFDFEHYGMYSGSEDRVRGWRDE